MCVWGAVPKPHFFGVVHFKHTHTRYPKGTAPFLLTFLKATVNGMPLSDPLTVVWQGGPYMYGYTHRSCRKKIQKGNWFAKIPRFQKMGRHLGYADCGTVFQVLVLSTLHTTSSNSGIYFARPPQKCNQITTSPAKVFLVTQQGVV